MPQQYKIDKVAEIESRIAENAGLFVVNYNGLTVKQAQELRHQLRECGAEMKVYKNNLVKIALKNQEQPELDEIIAGPVAYVFYESEPCLLYTSFAGGAIAVVGVILAITVLFPAIRRAKPVA